MVAEAGAGASVVEAVVSVVVAALALVVSVAGDEVPGAVEPGAVVQQAEQRLPDLLL